MNIRTLFSALAILLCSAASAFGQNARITHTITRQTHAPATLGRDLWFTMIKNYDDQAGKYYNLYVTSPQQTNIFVNFANQATKVLPVQPFSVAAFNIPLSWEVKSSAIVESKTIHVWSQDGDICAYLMSHNPYTSDGMYIIPSIGWGTVNVVAAYNALFEFTFDYPSEMAIIANQDNTVCTIIPSCDIRGESSPRACQTCIAHPKGIPFTETLMKGQCVQYESILVQDAENFDMTGTIVRSNNPVGIVGGSMCPNIPMDYPYCDHVCEMIPPVRTWGRTYISAPFYPDTAGKQWSSFLVIGTKGNQIIYRSDPTMSKSQYCVLGAQYSTYLRPDIDQASKWESADPFLLVQYINSSTYPDGVKGQGDPAEVVIPAVEQWPTSVVIQTPVSIGNQSPYKNYVNILVNNAAVKSTKFDGQGMVNFTHMPVDNNYSVYRVTGVKAGAHMITSDSGVGVYTYGYGFDESYAWSSPMNTGTFNSPDTIAPFATTSGQCFSAHVALLDSGWQQSKLSFIRLDTIYNMAYNRTDPNWQEGIGRNSSYYDMYVLDSSKPAYLGISVFDIGGNRTTIRSSYALQMAVIAPPAQDFGIGKLISGPPVYQWDTITNVGTVPFAFTDLRLLNPGYGVGKSGFTIDSAVKTPIAVGGVRIIKLAFIPQQSMTAFDTIVFGDACVQQRVIVYGTGGGADFRITDYNFGLVPIFDATNTALHFAKSSETALPKQPGLHIVNLSNHTLVVDSIWTDDPRFVLDPTLSKPVSIGPSGDLAIACTFTPTSTGQVWSSWHARSSSVGDNGLVLGSRNGKLGGEAGMPGQRFSADTLDFESCVSATTSVQILDTLIATGALGSDITNITHSASNDPLWTGFEVFTQFGSICDFTKNPEHLPMGDMLFVIENFHPPTGVTKAFYDTITATTAAGDVLRVHSTVQTIYRAATVTPQTVRFPKVPYQDPEPPTQSFYVINTADTDLTVSSIQTAPPGGKYDGAYKIAAIIPPVPTTLRPGQSVRVAVNFDPSFSPDTDQAAHFLAYSDACNAPLTVTFLSQSNAAGVIVADESADVRLEAGDDGRILRATLPESWNGPVHLELDNLLGVKMLSAIGIGSTGGQIQFDLQGLASGVYFYRVTSGGKSASGKVVIQK